MYNSNRYGCVHTIMAMPYLFIIGIGHTFIRLETVNAFGEFCADCFPLIFRGGSGNQVYRPVIKIRSHVPMEFLALKHSAGFPIDRVLYGFFLQNCPLCVLEFSARYRRVTLHGVAILLQYYIDIGSKRIRCRQKHHKQLIRLNG